MRQADLGRVALFTFSFVALLVACNSNRPVPETLGKAESELGTLLKGEACNSTTQCTPGLTCVDTVCCNTTCGATAADPNGARDAFACSNVYGVVPGLVVGECKPLVTGNPCGKLEGLDPCTWRGTTINGGGQCPNPSNQDPNACYTCVSGACPPGLPICNPATKGCSACTADFGGGTGSCPDSRLKVCSSGACVQCGFGVSNPALLNDAACKATTTTGSCDTNLNTCVGCNGDAGSGATFQCSAATPVCLGTGACVACGPGKPGSCPAGTVCDANNTCQQCVTAADCVAVVPPAPFCVNNSCVSKCATNVDCAGTLATPFCDVINGGICVECLTDATCALATPSTPFCAGLPLSCKQCAANSDCPATAPFCSAGDCKACAGNAGTGTTRDCPVGVAVLPACETAGAQAGACVQCTVGFPNQCSGVTSVCNPATDTCVQCTVANATACTGSTPVCNLASSTCVACVNNKGGAAPACSSDAAPACVGGKCLECSAGDSSVCTATGRVCKTTTNLCVDCTANADCVGANGVCDLATNKCTTGCASDANCSGATPKCNPATSVCVQCLDSAADCVAPTPSCDPATKTCVQCVTDAACVGTPTTPLCVAGSCVACNGDQGSGTTRACKSLTAPACVKVGVDAGQCVQCTTTDLVLCVGATPACNNTSHQCVQCASNAQCSGKTPICNGTGTCIACNGDLGSNASAACSSALKPACIGGAAANAGSCTPCSATNKTACTGATPVCDTVANLCVQCNTNAECTGPNGVCDTSKHQCTLGCTTDANCLSAKPACKTPDNFCVECTATNKTACVGAKPQCDVANNKCVGCNTGVDCPGAMPVCDPVTKTCTADCTLSSQCPGDAPICDPVTKKCVGCVTIADCKEPTPICNTTTHMCGADCTKSSECPGSAPVCNPVTKKCVPCTSNTDCPFGQICNTTTNKCGTDCSKSSECPGDAPICDPKNHQCVGCVDDTSCPSTAPLCDGTTKKCVADQTTSIEGGGCACSTVPSRGTKTIPVLVGLGLALSALARRRRSRRDLNPRA